MAGFSTGGAVGGAGTGAMIGSVVPGVGTAIGAGIGFIAGGLLGGLSDSKQEKAQREAKQAAEQARVGAIMRQFGAQQQAAQTVKAGFKRAGTTETKQKSKSVNLPDPIADSSSEGFIGGGLSNTAATGSSTSGTF